MLEEFEFMMFPFWEEAKEEISFTKVNEMDDPTQGDEIRTPWGGCVD